MNPPRTNFPLAALGFIVCALPAMSSLENRQLIFNDEFAESSFTNDTLNWNDKWNKIDYVNWQSVSDWRKYQSRDDALVRSGNDGNTDYVTLKGTYGDYTSQSDQAGNADTFACGGMFTDKTFTFQYGYMEVRAQFESAQGCWPAIWLMPVSSTGWLPSGEIDIMEHINNESSVHQTLHLLNNAGTADASPSKQASISNPNGWHTYGLDWTPEAITFYIDGTATKTISASTYTNWPFSDENHEFYILIDQQIGGSWAGGANATALANDSVDFNIDYVRVYSTAAAANSTPSGLWDSEHHAPLDANGNSIAYATVSDKTGGNLDQASPGHYQFTIESDISHILAEQSHIKLTTASGNNTIAMNNAMVQAQSLYLAEGKYTLGGSATLDVGTLYVVGGSLQVDFDYALSSVQQLYLGIETDAITAFAQRNASLYFTANQHINADVTLIDDSKIAVLQGHTLQINGNIHSDAHTLNLVGVNSDGTAHIVLAGAQNNIHRLALGVAETSPAGNTFLGAGQILDLSLENGSNTQIRTLVTHSPLADSPSSLRIKSGAALAVTDNWQHLNSTPFRLHIEEGGLFSISQADTQDSGACISGAGTIRKIQNTQATISTASDFSGSIESQAGELCITGSALFAEAAATGGELTFLQMNNGITVHTLRIYEGSSLGVFSGAVADATFESSITVTGALHAGAGTLNADLVLADGALLDITDTKGLNMGSSITLKGKVTLGDSIISTLAADDFESYTLAGGLEGFASAEGSWANHTAKNAADYFQAEGIDLSRYSLLYEWENPQDATSGMLRITKNIPEPTSSILSMICLAALIAQRRRK